MYDVDKCLYIIIYSPHSAFNNSTHYVEVSACWNSILQVASYCKLEVYTSHTQLQSINNNWITLGLC
jgi:hypothetical protein